LISDWIVDLEATKTEKGKKHKECVRCGILMMEEDIPAVGSLGLEYTINYNGTCTITGIGTCNDTELYIPEYIGDYRVTTIGSRAFQGCNSFTSVTIGNGVSYIESQAFEDCTKLSKLTLGSSVSSIGYRAFNNCTSLLEVIIPGSVEKIGSYTFADCTALVNVVICDGVSEISDWIFSGCSNLFSIVIPNSVTSINAGAFHGCSSLTSITYGGKMEQWNTIVRRYQWDDYTGAYTIYCTNGEMKKQ